MQEITVPHRQTIPDWYAADWTPALSRWELPHMTWDAIETVVAASTLPPERKVNALGLYRALWRESASMTPLDLLQAFLTTTARAFDPRRTAPPRAMREAAAPATGPLPRWSFTDLEMVLTCTWTGAALFAATERHHDLLEKRGDRLSAAETVRQIILMTAGLPSTPPAATRERRTRPPIAA